VTGEFFSQIERSLHETDFSTGRFQSFNQDRAGDASCTAAMVSYYK
jgi:hypothetical protein